MKKFAILVVILLLQNPVEAQTCGFGCLGMSGFYGGYTFQEYNADGLNSYIMESLSIEMPTDKNDIFGRAEGYRFGGNLFRADFDGYFITAKGFYQLLKEKHSFRNSLNSTTNYELDLNYFSFGVDFGFNLFSVFDLKLLEGGLTIHRTKLTINNKDFFPANTVYKTDKTDISYYAATGLIINIIPKYISIEGTFAYHIFNVDELADDLGNEVYGGGKNTNLLSGNKFSLTAQINLGIPF